MPHEEFNDALKRNIKLAVGRYQFAVNCLKGEKKIITDAGSGSGYGSQMLRESGHIVLGLDKSEEAIEYAQKNYPGEYYVADLEMDLNGFYADVVVCLEVLCHLENPQAFIDKIVAPEVIISAPIDPNPKDGYKYRLWNLSEKQFRDLLKGWKVLNELWQKDKSGTKYLTIYCKRV